MASSINSWATELESSGLDVQFGCVGYDVWGDISGALNLSNKEEVYNYLNRSSVSGTNRTVGFLDTNLSTAANSGYNECTDECGGVALHFANDLFTFRNGSNRIYVNFTDEPNQPYRIEKYSVEYVKDQNNWNTTKGTIHTVYSGSTFTETLLYNEYPWKMSQYTGGSEMFTSSSFTGVTLSDLPVSDAMQNSYIIIFTNIDKYLDGKPHTIKITIKTKDGKICADKEFSVTLGVVA